MSVKFNNETIAGKYKAQIIDVSNLVTKGELQAELSSYATKSDVDNVLAEIEQLLSEV